MVGDSIVGIIRHTYVCNESACSNTWNCDLFIYTPKCAAKLQFLWTKSARVTFKYALLKLKNAATTGSTTAKKVTDVQAFRW